MNEYAKLLTSPPSAATSKKDAGKKIQKAYDKKKSMLESFATELRQ